MNVIIANKYNGMLESLEIDVIKSIIGEYDVQEVVDMFKNIFFQRMILDITAIRNYQDIRNIQKLVLDIDADKIILLLDQNDESIHNDYLSKLVSMGLYNFTSSKEGIVYQLNSPNTYKDVAHFQNLDPNMTANVSGVSSGYESVGTTGNAKVIGFKNVTDHAGATTLIYMFLKQLMTYRNVVAIEYNRRDFQFFNNERMISTDKDSFSKILIDNSDRDYILVDLNDCPSLDMCNEVVYLIEPTIIKLNKLMTRKRTALEEIQSKTIILNKSMLTDDKDIKRFAYESNLNVYANIPPLNERINDNDFIVNFLQNSSLFNKE